MPRNRFGSGRLSRMFGPPRVPHSPRARHIGCRWCPIRRLWVAVKCTIRRHSTSVVAMLGASARTHSSAHVRSSADAARVACTGASLESRRLLRRVIPTELALASSSVIRALIRARASCLAHVGPLIRIIADCSGSRESLVRATVPALFDAGGSLGIRPAPALMARSVLFGVFGAYGLLSVRSSLAWSRPRAIALVARIL